MLAGYAIKAVLTTKRRRPAARLTIRIAEATAAAARTSLQSRLPHPQVRLIDIDFTRSLFNAGDTLPRAMKRRT